MMTEAFDMPSSVRAFVCSLQNYMGAERFTAAALANRAEPNPDVCHMHDYCDANAFALDAAGGDMDLAEEIYETARPFLRG